MFTGIVTDLGRLRKRHEDVGSDTRLEFFTAYDMNTVDIGASIACSGVCMTVIEKGPDWFAARASEETLSRTNLGELGEGDAVNLERSLKIGDEMGGHIVSGHVDGVGEVIAIAPENQSKRFAFRVPASLTNFVAPKGSIAVNGVSLTVNAVEGDTFAVNVIPHTQEVTTFGRCRVGGRVNIEIDMLARYVARLLERG